MIFSAGVLVCPVCGAPLDEAGWSYICRGGKNGKKHCFDRGASGYVNLAFVRGHGAVSGDPPEAVRSRSAFLDGGYYLPAADALLRIADRYAPGGLLADAGIIRYTWRGTAGLFSAQICRDRLPTMPPNALPRREKPISVGLPLHLSLNFRLRTAVPMLCFVCFLRARRENIHVC